MAKRRDPGIEALRNNIKEGSKRAEHMGKQGVPVHYVRTPPPKPNPLLDPKPRKPKS
jgi:hypothetical protein